MVVTEQGAASGPSPGAHREADAGSTTGNRGRLLVLSVLLLVLAAPLVVVSIVASQPTWYAQDDYALTEMRVRDVTSASPPLVGLSGRIGHDGVAGSHPGPLSFYVLAPVYRLAGSSSWALQVATAVLAFTALSLAVWLGHRRAGSVGAVAAATGMAALLVAYGPWRWVLPWNPSLPLLWWPVVLLAAWSVMCRDWPAVLVFVAAGSFCAQTHISYIGLVGGLALLVGGWMGWATWSARGGPAERPSGGAVPVEGSAAGHGQRRERPGLWLLAGGALLVALWAPPFVDQARHDPGNLSIIAGQFLDPDAPPAGWRTAVDVTLARLDPTAVLSGRALVNGPSPGGVLLAGAWLLAATAAVARRSRLPTDLVRLHVVVGVAAVLGVVSLSRIQGVPWPYLTLWSWGTAVAMAGATVWTAQVTWFPDARLAGRDRVPRPWLALALAPLAAALAFATVDAAGFRVDDRSPQHAAVFPAAFDALAQGRAEGFGPEDRYLVTARDSFTGGMSVFTVLNELERRGFDAGVSPALTVPVRPSRVIAPGDATAVLTYAVGPAIDEMRARPDAVELARADLPAPQRDEAARLRDEVKAFLEAAGRPDLVAQVDTNLFAMTVVEGVPPGVERSLQRLIGLGGPVALFVEPAQAG